MKERALYKIRMIVEKTPNIGVFCAIALAAATSGCSLKNNESSTTTVSVNIPPHSKSNATRLENPNSLESVLAAVNANVTSHNSQLPPGTISDFKCYAVNISGGGIPAAGGTSCSDMTPGGYIGIYGGTFPAGTHTVSFEVPNGSGIEIQLIGFAGSGSSCPDLSTIFSGSGNGSNNLNVPWLLASTNINLTSDTTVSLTASYNQASAQQLFQNCAIGASARTIAPTLAFYGTASGGGGNHGDVAAALSQDISPGGLPNPGSPLGGTITAVSGLSNLPSSCSNNCQDQSPLSAGMVRATTPSGRAAIEFAWDLTEAGTNLTDFGNFSLYFRGGQADDCATSQSYGASAGIWDVNASEWMSVGSGNYQNNSNSDTLIQWFSGSAPIGDSISNHVVTGTDGHSYVVALVESNYFGNSNCNSAVYVSAAGFAAATTVADEINNASNFSVTSNAVQTADGNLLVGSGQRVLFAAQGGTPPYTYSTTDTGTGANIGVTNGVYTPSSGGTVTVTDSSGGANPPITINTSLVSAAGQAALISVDPTSMSSLTANADGSYSVQAGTCLDFDANEVSYAGASTSFTSASINFSTSSGGTLPIYESGCSTLVGTATLSSQQNSGFYLQPTQTGFVSIYPSTTGLADSLNQGVGLYVTPTVYGGLVVQLPPLISSGECIPVTAQVADTYGNLNPISGIPTSSIPVNWTGNLGSFGKLYSGTDSTCASSINSFTYTPGTGPYPLYFKDIGTNDSLTVSSSNLLLPPGNHQVTGSQPVAFQVALDSSSAGPEGPNCCIGLDLSTVDSLGAPTSYSGGIAVSAGLPTNAMMYNSKADCDSASSGSTSIFTMSTNTALSTKTIWISNMCNSNSVNFAQSSTTTSYPLTSAQYSY